jgi:hypothetical protein
MWSVILNPLPACYNHQVILKIYTHRQKPTMKSKPPQLGFSIRIVKTPQVISMCMQGWKALRRRCSGYLLTCSSWLSRWAAHQNYLRGLAYHCQGSVQPISQSLRGYHSTGVTLKAPQWLWCIAMIGNHCQDLLLDRKMNFRIL